MTKFEDLIGKEVAFCGVDSNRFKLGCDVFEAVEDENDGYRSMLEEVKNVETYLTPPASVFFKTALDMVKVVKFDDGYTDGYQLVSVKDGHVWLEFGTSNYDDYYPCFHFEYTPRVPHA